MGQNSNLKITNQRMAKRLFVICWIVYFSTYLGRLNYSAALTDIIASGNLTKEQGGLIGTGFFLAYGLGQLLSGFLGDKLPPKWLVFCGMMSSACMNLFMFQVSNPNMMLVIWTVNGLSQAFIWSPMIRVLCEYLKEETRLRYCLFMNSSVPIGTMVAYGLTAAIIYFLQWKHIFSMASILLFVIGILWVVELTKVERYASKYGELEEVKQELESGQAKKSNQFCREKVTKSKSSLIHIMLVSGLGVILVALMIQGTLKDGVTTWIPTYMNETYNLGSVVAIIGTMIIPIFNLLGIFLARIVNEKWLKNEIHTAGFFFVICAVSLGVLFLTSGQSVLVAFVMLTISTTTMMAVNTMLIAVLPSHFGKVGKASTVSGILNSSVYIGGAISTYGIGSLSNVIGWKMTILGWLVLSIGAAICCYCVWKKWSVYKKQQLG